MNKTSNNGKKVKIIDEALIEQIKEMYTLGYPMDIAKSLKIKASDVYDVIYSLSRDEEKSLRVKRIKKIPLCKEVVSNAKAKKITIEQELQQMTMEIKDPQKRLELAQIYFWLRNVSIPEKILNEMISNVFMDKKIRKKLAEERDKIHNETLALKIRNNRRINKDISTEELCKKYEIKEKFVIDVLGDEEEKELTL